LAAPEGKFNGMKDVVADVMKTDGIRGMYKGLVPVMLRAFPANAVSKNLHKIFAQLNIHSG